MSSARQVEEEVSSNGEPATESEPKVVRISTVRKKMEIEIEVQEGVWKRFVVRELSGAEVDRYQGFRMKKGRLSEDGKTFILKDVEDLRAELIALSISEEDGKKYFVPAIRQWSTTAQDQLFDLCETISGLKKGGADEEKKD